MTQLSRTVSIGPNGFVVSDDPEGLLGRLLGNVLLGEHPLEISTIFKPDGEGFWIQGIGGALRIEDRESLPPPYDEDPALDPDTAEIWSVEREIRYRERQQLILTGNELRTLLTAAQQLHESQKHRT